MNRRRLGIEPPRSRGTKKPEGDIDLVELWRDVDDAIDDDAKDKPKGLSTRKIKKLADRIVSEYQRLGLSLIDDADRAKVADIVAERIKGEPPTRLERCDDCRGSGYEPVTYSGAQRYPCDPCRGTGQVAVEIGIAAPSEIDVDALAPLSANDDPVDPYMPPPPQDDDGRADRINRLKKPAKKPRKRKAETSDVPGWVKFEKPKTETVYDRIMRENSDDAAPWD